jgi:hypothetical protein
MGILREPLFCCPYLASTKIELMYALQTIPRLRDVTEMGVHVFYKKIFTRLFVAVLAATGAVCDQKTSKFFVSHQEESMAGYVFGNGVN